VTHKEIEIQMALGTIQPQDLNAEDFNHWMHLSEQLMARDMKAAEEKRLRSAGQSTEDSKQND